MIPLDYQIGALDLDTGPFFRIGRNSVPLAFARSSDENILRARGTASENADFLTRCAASILLQTDPVALDNRRTDLEQNATNRVF